MTRVSLVGVAITLAFWSVPAFADDVKFDLVCTGTETSNFGSDVARTRPWNVRISIDLSKRLYAVPYFTAPKQIFDVQPDRITLEQAKGSISTEDFTVDRTTGKVSWVNQLAVLSSLKRAEKTGVCQKAEFTQLPATLF